MKRSGKGKTREEIRAYDRAWWAALTPEERRQKIGVRGARRRAIGAWAACYKSERGCSVCPEKDARCLDFHHLGEKEREVGDMVRLGFSRARILKEIAKCRILCANCHRKLHRME